MEANLFGENLKRKRQEFGRTQQDMAKILHIQKSTYGGYERGEILPPIDKLEVIARSFLTSIDELIGLKMDTKLKHTVITDSEVLAKRYKKWRDVIGDGYFTDEEIDELMEYAKYIMWRRKMTKNG